MNPFPILDLIAGMIFLYFLLAIVNNSCLELFATVIQWRARLLVKWMKSVFGNAANDILMNATSGTLVWGKKMPDYLHAKDFAHAVVAHLQAENPSTAVWDEAHLKEAVERTAFTVPVKKLLSTFVAETHPESEVGDHFVLMHFGQQIENWFHRSMRHLTDSYKRSAMYFTFVFATLTTLVLNMDSIQLASYLYSHPQERQMLANDSDAMTETKNAEAMDTLRAFDIQERRHAGMMNRMHAKTEMNLQLPIGWPDVEVLVRKSSPFWRWTKKAGGLFITIMAICLGAPFWFEVLGKLANLRSSLKPIEEMSKKK